MYPDGLTVKYWNDSTIWPNNTVPTGGSNIIILKI